MKYLLVGTVLILVSNLVLGQIKKDNDGKSSQTAEDDSDMYMDALEQEIEQSQIETRDNHQQNFYPSFPPFQNQPLGHSRPFFYNNQQEGAYSQRPQSPYHQQVSYDTPVRYSGYKGDSYQQAAASESLGLLGSGNFGVIRGGTFYNDNEGGESSNYENDFNSYFHNGHGRPSFYFGGPSNPRPYQHEQFANFRDFADINTPSDRQYSQYVVVYVNKNGTEDAESSKKIIQKPKNIIESLALLDMDESVTTTTEQVPEKKLSKSKRKLANLLPEKKYKIKKVKHIKKLSRDLHEPLLALS